MKVVFVNVIFLGVLFFVIMFLLIVYKFYEFGVIRVVKSDVSILNKLIKC